MSHQLITDTLQSLAIIVLALGGIWEARRRRRLPTLTEGEGDPVIRRGLPKPSPSVSGEVPPVLHVDLTKAVLKNGEWYAFDLEGFKFYATVYNNGATGFLELTQIPDPYAASVPASGKAKP